MYVYVTKVSHKCDFKNWLKYLLKYLVGTCKPNCHKQSELVVIGKRYSGIPIHFYIKRVGYTTL
jgi:hypothetical protein